MAISFKVDKAELEENTADRGGSYEPLPEGAYEAELIDVKLQKFAKSGKYADVDCYALTWKLTEDNEVGKNRRVWHNILLAEKWLPTEKNPQGAKNFTLQQFAAAAGFVDEEGNLEIPDADELIDSDIVIGLDLRIQKERTENGKTYPARNEVNRYLSPEQLDTRRRAGATPKVEVEKPSSNGLFGKVS